MIVPILPTPYNALSLCYAEVAELVDAADSKSAGSNVLGVQVPPSVPLYANNILNIKDIFYILGQFRDSYIFLGY